MIATVIYNKQASHLYRVLESICDFVVFDSLSVFFCLTFQTSTFFFRHFSSLTYLYLLFSISSCFTALGIDWWASKLNSNSFYVYKFLHNNTMWVNSSALPCRSVIAFRLPHSSLRGLTRLSVPAASIIQQALCASTRSHRVHGLSPQKSASS